MLCLGSSLLEAPAAAQDFVDHGDFADVLEPSPNQMGAGVAFVDFDGDGWLDVLTAHFERGIFLYRNGGPPDFPFVDVTADVGLPMAMTSALGCGGADLDRDGDMDLVVADYGKLRVFENVGGRVREVTDDAFPGTPWTPVSVAFADVDGDGWTDVYAADFALLLDWPYHEGSESVLLRNRGDWTFEDVSASSGTNDPGCTLVALFSDYDRDGDPDLFSGNDFGMFVVPNRLFRNDGLRPDGTVAFTDVSAASGMNRRLYTMGTATADVDSNGYPDYFFTSIGRTVLLLGQPDGTFVEATDRYGVASDLGRRDWRINWGAGFLDVTNDGVWDLFVPNGHLMAANEIANAVDQLNLLYVGLDGADPARERGEALGVGARDIGHGAAIGDFDDDGDADILTSAIGGEVHLYRNDSAAGPAVRVRLRGTVSNPDAFGSWVALRCEGTFRERELVTAGSHASNHAPTVLLPLAGCDEGAEVVVTWPSGLVETRDVAGPSSVSLTEPAWFTVEPAWLPADGVSVATVRVAPNDATGTALGPGHEVSLSTTDGSLGGVVDVGDGSYEAVLTAPAVAGEAALTLTVDGDGFPAHPRARFYPAGGDRTTVHASPTYFIAGETVVHLNGVPRDAAGVADGPGADVSFDVTGATPLGPVVDEGDGRYGLDVRGNGGGPIDATAMVDGVPRGTPVRVREVARIDPDGSVVRLHPGWVSADYLEDTVAVFVSPRDGIGNLVPGSRDLDVLVLGPEGPVVPERVDTREGVVNLTIRARALLENQPADIVVEGVTLARTLVLEVYEDESELVAAVDPERTRIGPYLEGAYADGQDYAWVEVKLRDADGDAIPVPEGLGWSSDAMTVAETTVAMRGEEGKARMRTGLEPGPVWVDVTHDGEPIGVGLWVDLFPARTRDLEHDRVRTCLHAVTEDADGAGNVTVEVSGIDERECLLGSNFPLALWIDGAAAPLDYAKPGVYLGRVPVPAEPHLAVVQTEVVGTDRGSTLEIEFVVPGGEPSKHGRPHCAEVEPGFVLYEPDAGPDAGPDGGSDGGEEGGPSDSGPDDASTWFRGRAVGGGCSCSSAGGSPAAGVVLFVLPWLAVFGSTRRFSPALRARAREREEHVGR